MFTFGTFAIAFLMRPLGVIIFGKIGDRSGRKVVLTTTIILMAISTLLIGLLPTYDQIGVWAPILLLIARVIQGFSTGDEYAGAMVYIAESSPDNKRNVLGSGLEVGTLTGYILASLVASILFITLSDEQMGTWGWKIPFLLGLPLGLVGFYLRSGLEETLDEIIGLSTTTGTVLITITMIIMVPLALLFGKLGDKIGNKTVFLIGLGGLTLFSAVAFYLINLNGLIFISLGILILGVLLSTYEGTMPGSLPSMFHTDIRYRTLAVTFNVTVSLFGGTTPLISTWLVLKTGNNLAPAFYLTIVSIIGFLVISFLFSSTSGKSLKGFYPTVASKSEYKEAVENPKDALWWKEKE